MGANCDMETMKIEVPTTSEKGVGTPSKHCYAQKMREAVKNREPRELKWLIFEPHVSHMSLSDD